jgi:hypothetical protein
MLHEKVTNKVLLWLFELSHYVKKMTEGLRLEVRLLEQLGEALRNNYIPKSIT